jgi:suppressor of fused protein SUFU
MIGIEKRRTYDALRKHIGNYFLDHSIQEHQWNEGPIVKFLPRFSVLEVTPGPKTSLWTYISLGAWEIQHEQSGLLEFMVIAPEQSKQHILALAMTTYYHIENPLGVGHTFPIGEPWLEGSRCDHVLVSRPYPYGPEFEVCNLAKQNIHILWLLPITKAERDYKGEHGLEALENLFEESELEYWQINRESIV